jgi:SPP1 family predicted phage head-tail adaptor
MNIGEYNRQVTIESLGTGCDEIGQPSQVWTVFSYAWANIRFISGVEAVKGGAETSIAKASIRIRYRTNITEAMRVQYNGITYQIKAILPDEAKREYVDLACEVVK